MVQLAVSALVWSRWSSLRVEVRRPVKTLILTSVMGVTVATLTWRTPAPGIGWFLADLTLVAALLAGFARGRPGTSAWMLAAANVWLGFSTCRYASDWSAWTAAPGTAATLLLLAFVAASRTSPFMIHRVAHTCAESLRRVPGGMADAARVPVDAVGPALRSHARDLLRGALVGGPLAGLFVILLSADGRFRSALGDLAEWSGDAVSFALWAAVTTSVVLVATLVLRRVRHAREELGRVSAPSPPGGAYRAPVRSLSSVSTLPGSGARIQPLAWGVVLAQVLAVFAVYGVANVRGLFVGHGLMRARGTLTYAEYLHEGFAQVSLAAFLAITCVVAGHALLRPRGAHDRAAAWVGGRPIVALELGLLFFVAVALASCAHRLALYEDAYGYTYLRLGVRIAQLGIAGLLSMTAARCLARTWRGFGAALTWAAVAFVVVAGSLDADAWIAHQNVLRAARGAPLDLDYLASLSEDARGELSAIAALEPAGAARLAAVWADKQAARLDPGWRAWRGF